VVDDDVQDDIHTPCVGLFDQFLQILLGTKPWVHLQKILNAIPMIGIVLFLAVFEHRTEPYRVRAKPLNIIQPAHDAPEISSLENLALFRVPIFRGRIGIIRRKVFLIIVEAIHEQKIDEHVPPIIGRGKDLTSRREVKLPYGFHSVHHDLTLHVTGV